MLKLKTFLLIFLLTFSLGIAGVSNPVDLDNTESLGLNGTEDSVGYRVAEIEKHFHNIVMKIRG